MTTTKCKAMVYPEETVPMSPGSPFHKIVKGKQRQCSKKAKIGGYCVTHLKRDIGRYNKLHGIKR